MVGRFFWDEMSRALFGQGRVWGFLATSYDIIRVGVRLVYVDFYISRKLIILNRFILYFVYILFQISIKSIYF
jgi:hypothetical protein